MEEERRLFIGLPIPQRTSEALHALNPDIDGLRWLPKDVHHITLCFIGETRMDPYTEVLEILREEASEIPSFALPFRGLVAAPPKKPYMIWGRFEAVKGFEELHRNLFRRFFPDGDKVPEPKPHITLARMKRGKKLDKGMLPPSPEIGSLKVEKAVLWRSELQKGGAVHHPLGEAELGNGPTRTS